MSASTVDDPVATDRQLHVMADQSIQDVDSRLAQSVVDRTTDVDGNQTDTANNLGGGEGEVINTRNGNTTKAIDDSSDVNTASNNDNMAADTAAPSDVAQQTKEAEHSNEILQGVESVSDSTTKNDADRQAAKSASLKKPPVKSISLNKTFLSTSAASSQSGISSKGSILNDKGSRLQSGQQSGVLSSGPKPRLMISKMGGVAGRSGPGSRGRGDGQPVWNKNLPPQQPDSKKLSDEELQKQYGIHLTARLGADDPSNKEANWADIDDEEWNPPDEIEWNDGTKIALPPHEEAASPDSSKPPTGPPAEDNKSAPATGSSVGPSVPSPGFSANEPPDRKEPDKPIDAPSSRPTAWGPVSSGPFPVPRPTVNNQPYLMGMQMQMPPHHQQPQQHHHQMRPYDQQRQQPFNRPNDPRPMMHQPPPPPPLQPSKELPPDDFSRSWRERPAMPNRELFNSETGKLEPVQDPNRNRNIITRNGRPELGPTNPPALLQRQQPPPPNMQGPMIHMGEPSPAFQQQRSSPRIDMDARRRRASSTVSMGSTNGRRMSFSRNDILHNPEVFHVEDQLSHSGPLQPDYTPASQMQTSPTLSHKTLDGSPPAPALTGAAPYQAPNTTRGIYQPPSAHGAHHVQQAGPADAEAEDPVAVQERVMKEARELARKRREEVFKAEEEAKRARIQKKLAELEHNSEKKSENSSQEISKDAAEEVKPAEDTSFQVLPAGKVGSETSQVYRPPGERRNASPSKSIQDQSWRQGASNNHNSQPQSSWSGRSQQNSPWNPVAGEKTRFPQLDGLGGKTPGDGGSSSAQAQPNTEPQVRDSSRSSFSRRQEADNRVPDKWRQESSKSSSQDRATAEASKAGANGAQSPQPSQTKHSEQSLTKEAQHSSSSATTTAAPPPQSSAKGQREDRSEMPRSFNKAPHDNAQRPGFNQGGRQGYQNPQRGPRDSIPRDPRGRPLQNWNNGGEDPHARWKNPDLLLVQPRRPEPAPSKPVVGSDDSQEDAAEDPVKEPEIAAMQTTWRKVEVDQFGNRRFVKMPAEKKVENKAEAPEIKSPTSVSQLSGSPPQRQPMPGQYPPQGMPQPPHFQQPRTVSQQSQMSQSGHPQMAPPPMNRVPPQSPIGTAPMHPHMPGQNRAISQQHGMPPAPPPIPNANSQAGASSRPRYFPPGGAAMIQSHLEGQHGFDAAGHKPIEPPLQSPLQGTMQMQSGIPDVQHRQQHINRSPTMPHASIARGLSPSRSMGSGLSHKSDGPTSPRLHSSTTMQFEMIQERILGLVHKAPKTAANSTSHFTDASEPEYVVTSGNTNVLFVDETDLVTTSKPTFDEPRAPIVRVTVSLPGSRKQEPLEPEPPVEEDIQTRPTEEELFAELFPRDFGSLPFVNFPTVVPQALRRPAPQTDNGNGSRGKKRFGNVQLQSIPSEPAISREYNAMKRPIMAVKLGPDSERKEIVMATLHQQHQQSQQPQQQGPHGRNGNGRRQSAGGRGGAGEWRGGRGNNGYKMSRDGGSSPAGGYTHGQHHNGNNPQGNNSYKYNRNQSSLRGMPRKLASPVQ